jgi:hypothetical protein
VTHKLKGNATSLDIANRNVEEDTGALCMLLARQFHLNAPIFAWTSSDLLVSAMIAQLQLPCVVRVFSLR